MEPDNCWHCGTPREKSAFCRFCDHLQNPVPDYYEFFGLERKLSLDLADLRKRFYTMSRMVHPDRYMHAGPKERQYALEATAILNDAYRVLRDPVARVEYLLKERGLAGGAERAKDVPPELLEEVFELNMALEELRSGQEGVRQKLDEARRKFRALRESIDQELGALFAEYDRAPAPAIIAAIRGVLHRRRYADNLINQVESETAP